MGVWIAWWGRGGLCPHPRLPGPHSHLLTKAPWTWGWPLPTWALVPIHVAHTCYSVWLLLATGEPRPQQSTELWNGPMSQQGVRSQLRPCPALLTRHQDTVHDVLLGSVAMLAVAYGPEHASEPLLPMAKPHIQLCAAPHYGKEVGGWPGLGLS